jgi:hypothetical protein
LEQGVHEGGDPCRSALRTSSQRCLGRAAALPAAARQGAHKGPADPPPGMRRPRSRPPGARSTWRREQIPLPRRGAERCGGAGALSLGGGPPRSRHEPPISHHHPRAECSGGKRVAARRYGCGPRYMAQSSLEGLAGAGASLFMQIEHLAFWRYVLNCQTNNILFDEWNNRSDSIDEQPSAGRIAPRRRTSDFPSAASGERERQRCLGGKTDPGPRARMPSCGADPAPARSSSPGVACDVVRPTLSVEVSETIGSRTRTRFPPALILLGLHARPLAMKRAEASARGRDRRAAMSNLPRPFADGVCQEHLRS